MTEHDPGWEITGEDGPKQKIVRCPQCGEETVVNAEMAVITDYVRCTHCGNERQLNAPSPVVGLLVLVAVWVYAKTLHRPVRWIKARVERRSGE